MQNITFKENLFIKSDVASLMINSKHVASRILKAYMLLKYKPKHLQQYYRDILLEYINVNDLNCVIAELSLNEYSYNFWVNSIIEDIQYYKKPNKESDYNNKKAYEDEVKYAVFCFAKIISSMDKNAVIQLLEAILEDYRCAFVRDVAFMLLAEFQNVDIKGELSEKEKAENYQHVLSSEFRPKMILEFVKFKEYKNKKENFDENLSAGFMDSEQMSVPKKSVLEVRKILKESNKIVSARKFDSRSDAKNYVENMEKEYPDLFRIFEFKIVEI